MESRNEKDIARLLLQARKGIAEDMESREIGAIIWDNASAGFHYLPDVSVGKDGKTEVVRITGIYLYQGKLYLIKEGYTKAAINNFYTKGVDVAPTTVTLTQSVAGEDFGDPENNEGFYAGGTLDEWLVIADDYFEALNEQ